jgi:transposase
LVSVTVGWMTTGNGNRSTEPEEDLEQKVESLEREKASLERRLDRALAEIERLRRDLEEALHSLKRQAAPFSKGSSKPNPKPPGRKPGSAYGKRAFRPFPKRVDQQIAVPLPNNSPCCAAPIVYEDTKTQFEEDIVRLTIVRRFDIQVGRCACCGRHVQGRHPLQTSDALGAAQVQLGPEALSLAAHLNKEMGISHERVARVLELGYGLHTNRSTICRALLRLGKKAAPTYDRLVAATRASMVNQLDETGWRVAGHLEWLWVAVSKQITVYAILPGRGFEEAASILGEDYEGFLNHDGWAPYYRFTNAYHQTCISHLIRRCKDLIEIASPCGARFPMALVQLFLKGLALRDRYRHGNISLHGLYVATGRLENAMDRLLARTFHLPANRRLAKHLRHEQPHLFTFLHCPGIEATNNAAEQAIRPAVVARKTWGGNRTRNGALIQQILASILRTCRQQGKDAFSQFTGLLRSPSQKILDLVPAALSP